MAKQRVKTIRISTPMFNPIVGSMERKEPFFDNGKACKVIEYKKADSKSYRFMLEEI